MPGLPSAILVSAITGTLFSGPALAQPSDADALRGPSIQESPKSISLTKRDISGNVERLDTRPEQAALDLLGLSAGERKAPEQVLSDRYAAVTTLLQNHQALFLQLQQGRQGGAKPEELRPLMREMQAFAAPLLENPLQDQVAAALPEGKRAAFHTVVGEYKRISASEEPGGPRRRAGSESGRTRGRRGDATEMPDAGPTSAATARISARVEMNLLLRETARALNAIVVERREHTDALLKAVDATPEQEGQIRAIVRSRAETTDGKSPATSGAAARSPEERRANWDQIMALLTPEQRRKAMEYRRAN
ncbi:MAG TPA: hypothetical protein PKE29_08475 [Phycisphaerales bacterium]|nr:hypothetical protein [Phycisphaerales bacterium]